MFILYLYGSYIFFLFFCIYPSTEQKVQIKEHVLFSLPYLLRHVRVEHTKVICSRSALSVYK